jgi:hypothetical protein
MVLNHMIPQHCAFLYLTMTSICGPMTFYGSTNLNFPVIPETLECHISQRYSYPYGQGMWRCPGLKINARGDRSGTVVKVLRYKSEKVAGSIPDGVIGIFH